MCGVNSRIIESRGSTLLERIAEWEGEVRKREAANEELQNVHAQEIARVRTEHRAEIDSWKDLVEEERATAKSNRANLQFSLATRDSILRKEIAQLQAEVVDHKKEIARQAKHMEYLVVSPYSRVLAGKFHWVAWLFLIGTQSKMNSYRRAYSFVIWLIH